MRRFSIRIRRARRLALAAALGLAVAPGVADAAAGDVAASYADDLFPGAHDYGEAAAADALGRVYVAGTALVEPFDERLELARYTESGLDATFADAGKLRLDLPSFAYDVLVHNVRESQRVLVAGWAKSGSVTKPLVAAFWADGQNDSSWSGDGLATINVPGASYGELRGIARQDDGKVVVAGRALIGGKLQALVTRFTERGDLDPSFSGDGVFTAPLRRVLPGQPSVTSDGVLIEDVVLDAARDRILLAGSVFYPGPTYDRQLAVTIALRGDGTPDPDWGHDGALERLPSPPAGVRHVDLGPGNDEVAQAALQPDGKLLLAGDRRFALTPPPGATVERHIVTARLGPGGLLDKTYGGGDGLTDWRENNFAVASGLTLAGGRVLVSVADPGGATAASDDTIVVLGYTSSGSPDKSWGAGGVVRTNLNPQGSGYESPRAITVLPNGRIAVSGVIWSGFPSGHQDCLVVFYRAA